MSRTLQDKAEELVYDAIDELSDELEIPNNKYPEVYYVHRGFPFEKLGLSEIERYDFEFIKRNKTAGYFFVPKIIIVTNENKKEIFEESMHFLHFSTSKLKFNNRLKRDGLALNVLIEVLGYFGGKIGDPTRTKLRDCYPDIIDEREKCLEAIKKKRYDEKEFLIYQQSELIGEKLYNAYLSEIVSKKQICNFMSNKFKKENEALATFIELKYNFFEFLEKNY